MNNDMTIFKKYIYPLKGGVLLPYLIKIRGHQCEECKNKEWLGQPITLQVHHKDGDRTNNELENLQLLCPNCHSYTDNFGSKNRKKKISDEDFLSALQKESSIRQALFSLGLSDASGNYNRAYKLIEENNLSYKFNRKEENYCLDCGKKIEKNSTYCPSCFHKHQRTVERPSREELKRLIRNKPFIQIGYIYNVSDNAIRKWCVLEGLPKTKKEINSYSDEEWQQI